MTVGAVFEGLVDQRVEWMQHGACRGTNVDDFFPERGEYPRAALELCARCDVRQECLDYAMENRIAHGIFGGKSPRARQLSRRPAGLPAMFSAEIRARIAWLDKQGWTDREISEEFGCTRRTVQRVLRREERGQ